MCARGVGFKGKGGRKCKQRPGPWVKMDYLSPLLLSATANGLNGGPDISFLRAEREVVCHSVTYVWVPVQSPLVIHITSNITAGSLGSLCLRGSSITVSTTSRTSWASCSRQQRPQRCWTRGRRRRRKVKSRVLKVRREAGEEHVFKFTKHIPRAATAIYFAAINWLIVQSILP